MNGAKCRQRLLSPRRFRPNTCRRIEKFNFNAVWMFNTKHPHLMWVFCLL
jgi:hypothetical protein